MVQKKTENIQWQKPEKYICTCSSSLGASAMVALADGTKYRRISSAPNKRSYKYN